MRALPALLAMAALVLSGCYPSPTAGPSTSSPVMHVSPRSSAKQTKPSRSPSAVPVPGWADDVVPAGNAAFVVGWSSDGSGALWRVEPTGGLSRRTAPPGMPGNPGSAAPRSMLGLVFDDPATGMSITGTEADRHHRRHTSLYATDDGARTWTSVRLPTREQVAQVAIGDGAAYALTSDCPKPPLACDHAMLWSVDPAGSAPPRTFDNLPRSADTSGEIGLAAYGENVWVFLGMGAGKVVALRSPDGGRTWRRFHTGICLWDEPVATSGDVLWTTCGTGMLEHFTRQTSSAPPVGVFPGSVGGTTSSVLIPLTDTSAYAVIQDRHGVSVETTHDGGRTTGTIAPIPRAIARRGFRSTFVSQQVGYLVTLDGGQLYRTGDGAHHWSQIASPHP